MILMKLAVLNGDGIGPEVNAAARRIIDAASEKFGFSVEYHEAPIGGHAYRKTGDPYPDETRELCLQADAVLLGGSWDTRRDHARCYRRNDTFGPGYANRRTGFRCCADL